MAPADGGFQTFWNQYPRRVGKLAAQRAYEKARRSFTAEEILVGLANYVQHMPADPQYRCHPTTFLNQGRFLDDYDAPALKTATDWWEECKAIHGGTCSKRWNHEWLMKERA